MSAPTKNKKAAFTALACVLALVAAIPVAAQQGKKYGTRLLKEYAPKTAEEAAVLKVLICYQDAFNAHDLQKFVSMFVKDGAYRPCGSTSQPIASKECQQILTYNFGAYGFETYYDPQISVDGRKATVKLLAESGDYLADYTLWMQKVGPAWFVLKNDFINIRQKLD
jgi:hypothetical protein